MKNESAEQLWYKYQQGTCTPEEKAIIESWMLHYVEHSEHTPTEGEFLHAMEKIRSGLPLIERETAKRKILPPWLLPATIAAAAALIATLAFNQYFRSHNRIQKSENIQLADVLPGGNKAYLRLADGRRISLTDAANGKLAEQAGVQITKTASGQLVYTVSGAPSGGNSDAPNNTIETPKGGQYQVRLPDGSQVWLNAASSLTYPAHFSSTKARSVELTGEAYFEIRKSANHQAFLVRSSGQVVRVLGTHFNINAYPNEAGIKTTLLEGSVQVSAGAKAEVIKPGQQAILHGSALEVLPADTVTTTAWKNGRFTFNHANIQDIMRQVARWYDIDVKYSGAVPGDLFSGGIARSSSLPTLLKIFEASQIHFEIVQDKNRRTLLVKP
jgi:transmembrane sensor